MIRYFAKSLDRPIDIFGMKGAWIKIFLGMAGVSLLLGLIVGFSTNSGYGIATVFACVIFSVVFCFLMQNKVSHRELKRFFFSGHIPSCVERRETLSHILLKKKTENSWFYENHKQDLETDKEENKN